MPNPIFGVDMPAGPAPPGRARGGARVPTHTARGDAATLRLPRAQAADGPAGEAFTELARFGGALQKVAGDLQATENELQLAELSGQRTARLKDLRLKYQTDPELRALAARDPEEAAAQFARDAQAQDAEILKRVTRKPVAQALQTKFAQTLPSQIIDVKYEALALASQDKLARTAELEQQLEREVAEGGLEEQADALALHQELMGRMVRRGMLTAEAASNRHESFRDRIAEAQVLRDMRADPEATKQALEAGEYAVAPLKRESLIRQADSEWQRQLAREEAETVRQVRGREELVKAESDVILGTILEGGDVAVEIESRRGALGDRAAEALHTRNQIVQESRSRPGPSDPATVRRLQTALGLRLGGIDHNDLLVALDRGELNFESFTGLARQLREQRAWTPTVESAVKSGLATIRRAIPTPDEAAHFGIFAEANQGAESEFAASLRDDMTPADIDRLALDIALRFQKWVFGQYGISGTVNRVKAAQRFGRLFRDGLITEAEYDALIPMIEQLPEEGR